MKRKEEKEIQTGDEGTREDEPPPTFPWLCPCISSPAMHGMHSGELVVWSREHARV